jgi:hypothetical protein
MLTDFSFSLKLKLIQGLHDVLAHIIVITLCVQNLKLKKNTKARFTVERASRMCGMKISLRRIRGKKLSAIGDGAL